jgi:predicted nucleic acid-binding protein
VIVLDSSFLIGFYNIRDAHHARASSLMREFLDGRWGKGLLLEYVYLEVVTVLLMRADLATAASVAGILLESEELEFVPCSDLFADTVKRFSSQRKTKFSFTDCAIATAALQRTEGWVLTFDEEFRKLPANPVGGVAKKRKSRKQRRSRSRAFWYFFWRLRWAWRSRPVLVGSSASSRAV